MRNLLLTIVFTVLSVFTVSAVIKHYYSTELNDSINKINISVPCRIMYFDNDDNDIDNTNIVILDRSESYNVYYTVEDSTIYIKSNFYKFVNAGSYILLTYIIYNIGIELEFQLLKLCQR